MTRTAPLVTVVIPAYNAEPYILEAISSVLQQDYEPIEIVLVDDGSADRTASLVEAYAPQVRIIRQANSGVGAARNTGLRAATGDFICFLDADDGWYPNKVSMQISHLEANPEVGAVYHDWQVTKPNADGVYDTTLPHVVDQVVGIDGEKSGWLYKQLVLSCVIHTSTIMMRRVIAEQVGFFNTNLINGEDYDFWLRLSRLGRIDKLDSVLSFYRETAASLTTTVQPVNYELEVLESALRRWGNRDVDDYAVPSLVLKRRKAKLAFDFAHAHYRSGNRATARRYFFYALYHDPRRIKAIPLFLLSMLPRITGR